MERQSKKYYVLKPVSWTQIDENGLVLRSNEIDERKAIVVFARSAFEARERAQPFCVRLYGLIIPSGFVVVNLKVLSILKKLPEVVKVRCYKV